MVLLKTAEEIEHIRTASLLVAATHATVSAYIKPGVKTSYLDKIAEEFILDNQATPTFKGYGGFPASLCISENEKVVHGIPGDYEIKDGDIISIDCGVTKDGFIGDSAFTYPVGDVSAEVMALLEDTMMSLYLGIEQAVAGKRVGDISYAIQKYTEIDRGYGVVRELVGHGVGKKLHESPEVPNYGKRGRGPKLKEGMVIAIEPMINLGKRKIVQHKDGWTIASADKLPSAHFEHTVAVGSPKPDILSDFGIIFSALKNNNNIKEFHEKSRYLQPD